MTTQNSLPEVLSVQEAAAATGLHTHTIRRRISDGTLTAFRAGPRLLRIERESLLRMMSPVTAA